MESAMYFSALYAGMIMLTRWLDIAVKLRYERFDSSAFATADPRYFLVALKLISVITISSTLE